MNIRQPTPSFASTNPNAYERSKSNSGLNGNDRGVDSGRYSEFDHELFSTQDGEIFSCIYIYIYTYIPLFILFFFDQK